MNQVQIKHVQSRIGVEPDGFWGPLSIQAAKTHLRNLMPGREVTGFPTEKQIRSDISIYGPHGEPGPGNCTPPLKQINLPFRLYLYGAQSSPVNFLLAHEKCADSLLMVFEDLAHVCPTEALRQKAGILNYFGIYNPRFSRNSTVWSMHAYACAIDLDANRNGNRAHWPMQSSMPIEVMECFARQGWVSAGAFWSRDAMHFQATSF